MMVMSALGHCQTLYQLAMAWNVICQGRRCFFVVRVIITFVVQTKWDVMQ